MRNLTCPGIVWIFLAVAAAQDALTLEALPAERRILNEPLSRKPPRVVQFHYDDPEEAPGNFAAPWRLQPYSVAYFGNAGWPDRRPGSVWRYPGSNREQPGHPDAPLSGHRNVGPGFVSFDGDFRIERDRFVSFGVGDAMMGRPNAMKQVDAPVTVAPPRRTFAGRPKTVRPSVGPSEGQTALGSAVASEEETLRLSTPSGEERVGGQSGNGVNATEREEEALKDAHWVESSRSLRPKNEIESNRWIRTESPTESASNLRVKGQPPSELHSPSEPVASPPPSRPTVLESALPGAAPTTTEGSRDRFSGTSEKPPFSADTSRALSTGAIAGIAIGILAPLALVAGAVAYLLYGRRFVSGVRKVDAGSDAGHYIDDSVRPGGYANSHIELPKESSEEMTSLDNDSFLNSLEAVTIQNYWAESAKNTKV